MTIRLGDNQYGKAETHVVRITKGTGAHDIKDMTVSVALAGDFADTHLKGDNSKVVPTDTQKNTVFAFANEPVAEIEEFALKLARHFVNDFESVARARVTVEELPWVRITVDGKRSPNAFMRRGTEKRLAMVTCMRHSEWVVSGLSDMVVLKSAGSEFWGFPRDRYTTLEETRDRILATSLTARWRYTSSMVDWAESYDEGRRVLLETFASHHSLALQQTLYAMGEAVLEARREVCEIRLSMPNKHHFQFDLSPFGMKNENEVFYASDRPYGLIEGTVLRDDAPDGALAW
jgi:urate oxidase